MVTARLAIGSVSTLALGALLFGSIPYWLHRGTAHATPWGAISAPGASPSGEVSSQDDKAKLLQLAALKSGAAPEVVPTPAPAAIEPVAKPAASAEPPPAMVVPTATPPAAEPAPMQAVNADQAAAGQQVATAEDAAGSDVEAKSTLININTASASALDHLPGAGRIGHTIVSHRPYKSVKDLVNKRVLRLSDFQKIQSKVSVD